MSNKVIIENKIENKSPLFRFLNTFACCSHKPEVEGSSPSLATTLSYPELFNYLKKNLLI